MLCPWKLLFDRLVNIVNLKEARDHSLYNCFLFIGLGVASGMAMFLQVNYLCNINNYAKFPISDAHGYYSMRL